MAKDKPKKEKVFFDKKKHAMVYTPKGREIRELTKEDRTPVKAEPKDSSKAEPATKGNR